LVVVNSLENTFTGF